ncbi:MAG: galactokinase [Fimbriimonas sp.]
MTDIGELFRRRFGQDPEVIGIAPGRVNLIGEHTDYNDGFVFPAAIDKGLRIAAAKTDRHSQVSSAQLGDGETFDVTQVKPGQLQSWAKYPAGMGWALGHKVPNLLAVVDSDIPIGSGVSSSAAMEMAFGVVWNHLANLNIDPKPMAKLGQVCENQFVGVNSGIMDQMASALGKENMAMFLDTRTLEIDYAPIPEDLSIVLLDTKKPRALEASAYNERRSQCEEASRILGVDKLRDATMAQLVKCSGSMPTLVFRRARHVISENERCVRFKKALEQRDYTLIGTLMRASHESLRDDYEVTGKELDDMAEGAWESKGCVGARMTGAGFGGACVALVKTNAIDNFIDQTLKHYKQATGKSGEAMVCGAADGARILNA